MNTPVTRARQGKRTRRRGWLIALAVVAVVILVLALIWDWNWFKGPIERQVEAATGREFEIRGDLDVDFPPWAPVVRADGLRLGNAEWSEDPAMVEVGRLEAQIRLFPLLAGDIVLPRLDLEAPRVVLETNEEGVGNWEFGDDEPQQDEGPPDLPDLRALRVSDGELVFREGNRRTDLSLAVETREPDQEDAAAPVALAGEGSYRGAPFSLEGTIESPLELLDQDAPYRLDLSARAGATRAHVRGSVTGALQLEGVDVMLALSGANLADLYPLLGVALPDTPPYSLDGRFGYAGTTFTYRGFDGEVGDSDLHGDVSIDIGGDRLRLEADLTSQLLDIDDLAGFIGAPPETGEGETASEEQEQLAAEQEASGRLLPDEPYDLEKLNSLDADVRLRAQRIEAPRWPIDDMEAHLTLEKGLVRLDPLNFGVAGGQVRSTIQLDAGRPEIRTRADIGVRNLELPRLVPASDLLEQAAGRIAGDISLEGRGNSVAQMLGTSNGEVRLGMGSGHMSNLLLELAGLDVAQSVRYWLGRDREVTVRCAFADLEVEDGTASARALAFDTTDTLIVGSGSVNLSTEEIDLRVEPEPKDNTFLSVRTPIWIRGTMADPAIVPDAGGLARRGLAAAALGAIAPPAALLALLDFGGGENADCGQVPDAAQDAAQQQG
ncbi:AsmA family protein [Coralloluteibacterium stylophorae]|uniref:AsmA family protein n=1 Tax=Coralloluteibacterium stylophorae TaxID=1776034 RepID=A0A8J7VWY0_9GAMM|nr:AsmA family protein [Coralloluteibacterium stylophorae]MBS7456370.1 AsmA family protein [Coralloluteibacterium stylophorae]